MQSMSRLSLIFVFISFISVTLFGSFQDVLIEFKSPDFIEAIAEKPNMLQAIADEYGNKTANLCILHKLAPEITSKINNKKIVVRVPAFFAISHKAIKEALEEDFGLTQLWGDFKEKQGASETLVPAAVKVLKTIQQNIKEFFERKEILQDAKAIRKEIAKNLWRPEFKDKFLMVRSTGREDSKKIANAGGNESIASVKPNIGSVWDAMKKVVMSYFSTKSLSQRLISGDDILKDPFLPVLIQVMIGEKTWDENNPPFTVYEVPVSGVMFSQEAEGNTPGVTQIQVAYGHNEGVVNSLVDVDTFYVGKSGVINPVIRKKKMRIVAKKTKEGYRLDSQENFLRRKGSKDFSMQSKPALDKNLVMALKVVAEMIQNKYDYPMDIEFVISTGMKRNLISLVQARPLVKTRKKREKPSYIKDTYIETKEKLGDVLQGVSIGIAGGYVRVVKNAQEILVRDDLPQALNTYNDDPERDKIKVVVVSEMAPSTSHEATTFRGYNIPVLVFSKDNTQKIEKWANDFTNSLFFDTQQAIVVKGDKEGVQQIEQGWATHPVPMERSCFLSLFQPLGVFKKYLKELSFTDTKNIDKNAKMKELIEIVKTGTREEVLRALKTILYKMFSLLEPKKELGELKEVVLDVRFLGRFIRKIQAKFKKGYEPESWRTMRLFKKYVKAEKGFLDKTELMCLYALVTCAEILKSFEIKPESIKVYDFDKEKKKKKKSEEALRQAQDERGEEEEGESEEETERAERKREEQERLLRLAHLYPIKFLEALIGQKSGDDVLHGYAYFDLLKTYYKRFQAAKITSKEFTDAELKIAIPLIEDGKYALKTDVFKDWESCVNAIANFEGPQKARALRQIDGLVKDLKELEVLDLWLNTSFKKTWDAYTGLDDVKRSSESIEGLIKEFNNDREIISWVQDQQFRLAAWERKISEWADPDDFEKLLKKFTETFVKTFIIGDHEDKYEQLMYDKKTRKVAALNYELLKEFSQKFSPLTTRFNEATDLGKLVILRLLNKVVDVYDNTIKGLTGSAQYKNQKDLQARRFALLLVPYLSLMEQWTILVKPWESELMLMISDWAWPFSRYIPRVRSEFIKRSSNPKAKDLLATSGFSVAAAQIGSRADFARSLPQSLEDLFTLMHQNILVSSAVLNGKYGPKFDVLPKLVQSVGRELEKVGIAGQYGADKDYRTTLIGTDYNYPILKVFYNLPLRQHSGMFHITYDLSPEKSDELVLSVLLMGHNEGNRLYGICGFIMLASVASDFGFAKYPRVIGVVRSAKDSLETRWSWILHSNSDFEAMRKYLNEAAISTMNFVGNPRAMFYWVDKITPILKTPRPEKYWEDKRSVLDFFREVDKIKDLPGYFFSNSLYFSEDVIDNLIEEKAFAQALKILELTIGKLLRDNKKTFISHGNWIVLQQFLVNTIIKLLKNPEAEKEAAKVGLALLENVRFRSTFPTEYIILLNGFFEAKKLSTKLAKEKIAHYTADPKKIAMLDYEVIRAIFDLFVKIAEEGDLARFKDLVFGLYGIEGVSEEIVNYILQYFAQALVKKEQFKLAKEIVTLLLEKNVVDGAIEKLIEKQGDVELGKQAVLLLESKGELKSACHWIMKLLDKDIEFAKKMGRLLIKNKEFVKKFKYDLRELAEKLIAEGDFEFSKQVALKFIESKDFYNASVLGEKLFDEGALQEAANIAFKLRAMGDDWYVKEIDKKIKEVQIEKAKNLLEKQEFELVKEIILKLIDNEELNDAKKFTDALIDAGERELGKEAIFQLIKNRKFISAREWAVKLIDDFEFIKKIVLQLMENKQFVTAEKLAYKLIEEGALEEAADIASKLREEGRGVEELEKAIEEVKKR